MGDLKQGGRENDEIESLMTRVLPERHAAMCGAVLARLDVPFRAFFRDDARLDDALELLWGFAEGAGLDAAGAAQLRESFEATVGQLYDEDETGWPMYIIKAASSAFYHLAPREWDTPYECAFSASTAADCVGGDLALLEEAHWQVETLRWIAASNDLVRSVVESRVGRPKWVERIRSGGRS